MSREGQNSFHSLRRPRRIAKRNSHMRQWFSRPFVKWTFVALSAFVTLAIIITGVWLFRLDRNIKARFAEKRFAPPVEFYSSPESIRAGSRFPTGYFQSVFNRKDFRRREFSEPIREGDYSVWTPDQCRQVVAIDAVTDPAAQPQSDSFATEPSAALPTPAPVAELNRCVAFKNPQNPSGLKTQDPDAVHIIAIDSNDSVIAVYSGATPQKVDSVEIQPELFAQYYGEKPTLRTVVSLGEAPTMCLNALLAIEDSEFLEHSGIRFTGLLRAVLANLKSGWGAQGGSTITQQLVKNYFLTEEKTLKRKITEIAMAFLVERHASKDDILETYINLIYMGQNGPFQVRGFAAASEHYFGKPLHELSLDQCALLAAVLNSPGLYNPFTHPDHALKRRGLVLDRMHELHMISENEAQQAKAAPLPTRPQRSLTEPAPYFVQAVRRMLEKQGLDESEGLRVYTTLNLRAQEAAHQAVRNGLDRLEKNYPQIQKLKAKGKNLEAVLISANPATGAVEALVGGRGFLATQFNRAIDSHRQVGSVMKPFVYLTALEKMQEDGQPFTPLTILKDQATTHRFEGQVWTPRNYEGTYLGEVPLFYSLKESLNASTVNLGMSVGIDNIVETAQRMGITSKIKALPSLTLGAFELTPMEVLQAYSTIANLGSRTELSLIHRVEDLNGNSLYEYVPTPEQVAAPESTAELVGIMKQTINSGTGRGVRLSGFTRPAAGKTGTTNDKKDAWFAGFTPYQTAIVWVGYDDNTSHNLTGASGAVPIWTTFMKSYATSFPEDDFKWPEGVEPVTLSPEQELALGVPEKRGELPPPVELIFKRGQAPMPPEDPAAKSTPNPFKPGGI